MTDLVLRDLDDGVLVVTLNRREARNQWTAELETAYFDALEQADGDPAVRVIIVTGAGHTFCPGLDPAALATSAQGGTYLPNRRAMTYPTTLQKPLIAAINGACAGIGLLQALYCDYRFCVPAAKMTTAFSRRGLPAEDGAAWIITRLAGPSKGFDLLVTGRVFRSEEAWELGLVDRLVDPAELLPAALEYARAIVRDVSPVSAALIKRQVWADLGETLEQARLRSRHFLQVAKLQPDFAEGTQALVEGRSAQFPAFHGLRS